MIEREQQAVDQRPRPTQFLRHARQQAATKIPFLERGGHKDEEDKMQHLSLDQLGAREPLRQAHPQGQRFRDPIKPAFNDAAHWVQQGDAAPEAMKITGTHTRYWRQENANSPPSWQL